MQRLEVSGAVRPIYGSLGVKRLMAQINLTYWILLECNTTPRLESFNNADPNIVNRNDHPCKSVYSPASLLMILVLKHLQMGQ